MRRTRDRFPGKQRRVEKEALKQHGAEVSGEGLCGLRVKALANEHLHTTQHPSQFLRARASVHGGAYRRGGIAQSLANEGRCLGPHAFVMLQTGGRPHRLYRILRRKTRRRRRRQSRGLAPGRHKTMLEQMRQRTIYETMRADLKVCRYLERRVGGRSCGPRHLRSPSPSLIAPARSR